MNVKLDSKTFMDTLKDNPLLQLALMALLFLISRTMDLYDSFRQRSSSKP